METKSSLCSTQVHELKHKLTSQDDANHFYSLQVRIGNLFTSLYVSKNGVSLDAALEQAYSYYEGNALIIYKVESEAINGAIVYDGYDQRFYSTAQWERVMTQFTELDFSHVEEDLALFDEVVWNTTQQIFHRDDGWQALLEPHDWHDGSPITLSKLSTYLRERVRQPDVTYAEVSLYVLSRDYPHLVQALTLTILEHKEVLEPLVWAEFHKQQLVHVM